MSRHQIYDFRMLISRAVQRFVAPRQRGRKENGRYWMSSDDTHQFSKGVKIGRAIWARQRQGRG